MIFFFYRYGEYSIVVCDYYVGVFSDWCYVVQRYCFYVFWKFFELYFFIIVFFYKVIFKRNDMLLGKLREMIFLNLIKKIGICMISLFNNYVIFWLYECL